MTGTAWSDRQTAKSTFNSLVTCLGQSFIHSRGLATYHKNHFRCTVVGSVHIYDLSDRQERTLVIDWHL